MDIGLFDSQSKKAITKSIVGWVGGAGYFQS